MNGLKRLSALLAITAAIAGCTTIQAAQARDTEHWLATAGFVRKAADTPEKLAKLQGLPARTFVVRTRDGASEYLYADPTACQCVYVGTTQQYEEFRALRSAAERAYGQAWSVGDFASPFGGDSAWWW